MRDPGSVSYSAAIESAASRDTDDIPSEFARPTGRSRSATPRLLLLGVALGSGILVAAAALTAALFLLVVNRRSKSAEATYAETLVTVVQVLHEEATRTLKEKEKEKEKSNAIPELLTVALSYARDRYQRAAKATRSGPVGGK